MEIQPWRGEQVGEGRSDHRRNDSDIDVLAAFDGPATSDMTGTGVTGGSPGFHRIRLENVKDLGSSLLLEHCGFYSVYPRSAD
jgi:hypothetical protein